MNSSLNVDEFLYNYYNETAKVTSFHLEYLNRNSFAKPSIDYFKLKRFIDTATNNLYSMDPTLLSGLLGKLYQDIKALYEYYATFVKTVKVPSMIFYKDYLNKIEYYKKMRIESENLQEKMEHFKEMMDQSTMKLKTYKAVPKKEDEIQIYKSIKKQNVDSIYYFGEYREKYVKLKSELLSFEKKEEKKFLPRFTELKDRYTNELETIINTKYYYFDKLLWFEAQKSLIIQQFFDEADINGDYSTKTFISYYLKNIDVSKANDSEWINYLQSIVKSLE